MDFLLRTSDTSACLLSALYAKFALLLDAHNSLVYFKIKVSPVIRLYVSFCTLLCRHYSVISGVIVLILTIIM